MKPVLFSAIAIVLTACLPAPEFPVSDFPPPSGPGVLFVANNKGLPVQAQCRVGGPAMDIRFTTPATIPLSMGQYDGGISVIDCTYQGGRKVTDDIPKGQFASVTVDFDWTIDFIFRRANGATIY